MAWYRTGTVSVTNGSTTVTGSGTSWIDGAASGEGFYGPDGNLYEIAAIVSATQLTLGSAYLGATVSGQAYQIVPSQSYIRSLAAQAAALVNDYASVLSTVGIGKFSDGTLASPGIRFSSDENTGIRRVGADNLALVTNGADRVSVTSSAVAITGNLSVSGSITGTTTLASAVLTTADINGGTMDNVTIGGSTPAAGNFTNLDATGTLAVDGSVTLGDSSADAVTINGTVAPGVVISGSSSGNALRITQTGSGNALLVEDSTNPDASPFVIDATGRVIVGSTASLATGIGTPQLHTVGSSVSLAMSATTIFSNDTAGSNYVLGKSRGSLGTVGTIVSSGDFVGNIFFVADDGTSLIRAASISAVVDGTPGTNDMPGRLVFSTTADGASTPTERYRINSAGIHFFGNTTTNTNSTLMVVNGEISETTSGTQYKLASQYDIGTAPNEIPLNQYLGTMAFQSAEAINVGSVTTQQVAASTVTSSSKAGSGYATGAGSTVTQITSRTTGVTINAACGAITLVSAAGTTTPASFTVTNSSVVATDVIILNQKSGTDKQVLLVTAVAAGSFEITAYTTGGTTTEQPVINFAVIKAVTA